MYRIVASDEDIVGYIIEGIPDHHLRDIARVQRFTSRESLLAALEEITLRDKNETAAQNQVISPTAEKKNSAM